MAFLNRCFTLQVKEPVRGEVLPALSIVILGNTDISTWVSIDALDLLSDELGPGLQIPFIL